ncbi:hypothetical protein B566_EDAN004409 [Ephemera danica]|nr:hypothetical protein B566_EDAN004409 [Ephemera danica]
MSNTQFVNKLRLPCTLSCWLQVVTFTAVGDPGFGARAALTSLTSGLSVLQRGEVNQEAACEGRADGYHSGPGCTSYWLCKGGAVILQRSCTEGTLFNGLMCVPSALVTDCATPAVVAATSSVECAGLKNGLHRNYYIAGCSNYVICDNGKAVLKGKCKNNLIFDGNVCVEASESTLCNFDNNHTEDDMECSNKPSGVHTNSNCHNYYYCNNDLGIKSRIFECSKGFTFDVDLQKCVFGFNCSISRTEEDETETDFCFDKRDGYYQDPLASGCRSYMYCNAGKKIIYLCPEGYAFDGTSCQVDTSFTCPYSSHDCAGKSNGYHADPVTACRQYFYCLNQDKVMTLTCSKARIFDGSKCVPHAPNICGPLINASNKKFCEGKSNGKYILPGSNCRNFVFCHANRQFAHGSCTEGFVLVNNECVKKNESVSCNGDQIESARNCKETGVFRNFKSNACKDYFYCMNGQRTDLSCPANTVFNGHSCVDETSYDCSTSSNITSTTKCTVENC